MRDPYNPDSANARKLIQRWIGAPQTGDLNDPATVEELLQDVNGLNSYLLAKVSDVTKPEDEPTLLQPDDDRAAEFVLFPDPDYESMVDYYGEPGDKSNLTTIVFPYPMRLYSRKSPATYKKNWGVHKKFKPTLEHLFERWLEHFGADGLTRHGLDVFCGIFNDRNVRNGTAKSKHAWGAAVDINARENRNSQKWRADKVGKPGWANMPIDAIIIAESLGLKSGARAWGRDAMHYQGTQ